MIFIEKFTIPLLKFLSKKIEIKKPFVRIKNYFLPKEPLIIHFEPWNYNSSEEILKQFFKAVTNKLNSSNNECYLRVGYAPVITGA